MRSHIELSAYPYVVNACYGFLKSQANKLSNDFLFLITRLIEFITCNFVFNSISSVETASDQYRAAMAKLLTKNDYYDFYRLSNFIKSPQREILSPDEEVFSDENYEIDVLLPQEHYIVVTISKLIFFHYTQPERMCEISTFEQACKFYELQMFSQSLATIQGLNLFFKTLGEAKFAQHTLQEPNFKIYKISSSDKLAVSSVIKILDCSFKLYKNFDLYVGTLITDLVVYFDKAYDAFEKIVVIFLVIFYL